ncbi:MAG TPA: AMP-binding protein [Flavobacteriaceae bacterium]|nr:AMP-binding protein [Flavobacteriaceae bacterium]
MWQAKIHPKFKLQGVAKSEEKSWLEHAMFLQKSKEEDTKAIGDFLVEWLNASATICLTTSGSTGTPKPIYLQKHHMINSAIATAKYFDLQPGTTALLCMPAKFVAGKMMLVRAMQMGWELDYVPSSKNPLTEDKRYDFVAMTPYQVHHSLEDLDKAKIVLIGGGAVDVELHKQLQKSKAKAFASYGMTETCSHVALRPINGPDATSVYQATENVKFLLDERDCLIIDAPNVHDGILTTNDIIDLRSETSFVWKGRYDSVINSGGVKIHPEMVEQKLAEYLKCHFFIGSTPDAILENKVILLIESKEPIAKDLLQKAFRSLDKYEIPKKVFYLKSFKWTDTGKIQRKATLELLVNN